MIMVPDRSIFYIVLSLARDGVTESGVILAGCTKPRLRYCYGHEMLVKLSAALNVENPASAWELLLIFATGTIAIGFPISSLFNCT